MLPSSESETSPDRTLLDVVQLTVHWAPGPGLAILELQSSDGLVLGNCLPVVLTGSLSEAAELCQLAPLSHNGTGDLRLPLRSSALPEGSLVAYGRLLDYVNSTRIYFKDMLEPLPALSGCAWESVAPLPVVSTSERGDDRQSRTFMRDQVMRLEAMATGLLESFTRQKHSLESEECQQMKGHACSRNTTDKDDTNQHFSMLPSPSPILEGIIHSILELLSRDLGCMDMSPLIGQHPPPFSKDLKAGGIRSLESPGYLAALVTWQKVLPLGLKVPSLQRALMMSKDDRHCWMRLVLL